MKNTGRVLKREDLLKTLWGYSGDKETRTVLRIISRQNPNDPERPLNYFTAGAIFYLGECHYRKGNLQKAKDYSNEIESNYRDSKFFYRL